MTVFDAKAARNAHVVVAIQAGRSPIPIIFGPET